MLSVKKIYSFIKNIRKVPEKQITVKKRLPFSFIYCGYYVPGVKAHEDLSLQATKEKQRVIRLAIALCFECWATGEIDEWSFEGWYFEELDCQALIHSCMYNELLDFRYTPEDLSYFTVDYVNFNYKEANEDIMFLHERLKSTKKFLKQILLTIVITFLPSLGAIIYFNMQTDADMWKIICRNVLALYDSVVQLPEIFSCFTLVYTILKLLLIFFPMFVCIFFVTILYRRYGYFKIQNFLLFIAFAIFLLLVYLFVDLHLYKEIYFLLMGFSFCFWEYLISLYVNCSEIVWGVRRTKVYYLYSLLVSIYYAFQIVCLAHVFIILDLLYKVNVFICGS